MRKGYEACVAVKRIVGHELVVFDPHGFVDGQRGKSHFHKPRILRPCSAEISRIAYESETALTNLISRHAEALEAKEIVIRELASACERRLETNEAVIQELAAACEARLEVIKRLDAEVERLKRTVDLDNR